MGMFGSSCKGDVVQMGGWRTGRNFLSTLAYGPGEFFWKRYTKLIFFIEPYSFRHLERMNLDTRSLASGGTGSDCLHCLTANCLALA